MSSKVDAALKAREEKRKKELEESEKKREAKISAALAARDARIKGNLQSTLTDLNDRIKAEAEALKKVSTPSWGSDSYKSTVESTRESRINVEKLQREVEALRKYLGDEDTDRVLSSIDGMSKAYTSYLEAAEVYSNFDSEEEYNGYIKQQEDYAAKLEFDLDAGQAEIDTLKANRAEIDELLAELKSMAPGEGKYMNPTQLQTNSARLEAITARLKELGADDDGAIAGIDATISEKERYLREAKRLQEWQALGDVGNAESEYYDPDFAKYAEQGALKGLETHSAFAGTDGIKQTLGSDVNDRIIAFRNHRNEDGFPLASAIGGASGSNPFDEEIKFAQYMTDEQFQTYTYYYGKYGAEKAKEYLKSIEEQVNAQKAGRVFATIEDKWALEMVFGLGAGLDQFATGMENLFSQEDYIPQSAIQMASQMVREDLGESDFKILGSTIGQIAYDATTTTANMLPSILTSAAVNFVAPGAGALVGAGLLGASASGNAYAEMLNLGYSKDQAKNYAALVGASETVLQYILGGIGQLGGKLTGNALTKVVSKLDNAFARVAIKLGGDMASEGLEEGLQTVLEQWFKSVVTGMDFDAPGIDEVLYSSLLGMISAAGIGGVSTIGGEAYANIQAKKVYGGQSQALVDDALGSQFSEVQATGQKYQDKLKSGKSLSGMNLRNLLEVTDKSKIKSAVLQRLGELGETTDVTAVGEVLVKYALGEELSSRDNKILNDSTYGHQVLAELNTDNIKSGGLANNWAENIGTRTVQPSAYNKAVYELAKMVAGSMESAGQAKTMDLPESKFKASEGGKTIYNGEEVTIKGIDSVKDGELTLRLDNGETANASEVEFASDDEALLYSMVAMTGGSVETANELIGAYTSANTTAKTYATEAYRAYRYGRLGIENSLNDLSIPDAQKRIAYNRGSIDAMTDTAQRPAARTGKPSSKPKKNGIIYEGFKYSEKSATDLEKANIEGVETLAKLSPSLEFHVYRSELKNGKRVAYIDGKLVKKAPNGFFTQGNKIYLDLNAGNGGEGVMLYTLSHEITHYIRAWNAKGFKALADFLFANYGENDISIDDLIEKQKDKITKRLKEDGKDIPSEAKLFDMAYEELVADAMSSMLADPKAYEKLATLKMENPSVFKKLGEVIKNILDKLKSLLGIYEGKPLTTQEAKYVSQFAPEVYEKLQDLYLKAFVEAEANHESAEKTLADNGIAVNAETESASLLSVRDVLSDEQRKKVSLALATRFGVTQQEAMDWLKAETSMASLILNPKYSQYLDYTPDPNEVAIKQNLDYPQGTVDFSPICAKRREFTSVMNNILRLFPNHVFAATDLAKIRTIMQEEGMTIPCGICYVEDRRQLDTIVAQNFIDSLKLYREGSKTRPDGKPFNANQLKGLSLIDGDSYTPSVYELVSLEGLNVLKEKNPNMAEAWVKFNNARGMQAVRLLANEAEYKRQILKYSKKTVQSKNDHGGLRVYSFSDAEMFHLIDIIQVITDSATVGLYLQGYTKVNEYARTVKDTGEKLNRSLIPKGELGYHIEDGKVVLDYDTVEGIDINHPDFFDNKDNPDVGNITIGVSDVQIRAAMVSDFVDQIIPFHTGQSDEVLGEKGIATWSNYKDFQTEKDIATGKVSEHQINIYTEVLQVLEKEGKPITKRTFVEKFLEVCKENGLTPRFSQFLNTNEKGEYVYTEGYHKMLVDFKTFAQTEVGEYLPQRAVKPIFDNEYITKILKDYVKSQKVKDAELAESMPKVIERITNEIVKADDTQFSDRDSNETVTQFLSHMDSIVKTNGRYYGAVYDYVAEHPELNFIERLYAKDKDAEKDLTSFLSKIQNAYALHRLYAYMAYSYTNKGVTAYGKSLWQPYRDPVRTFKNAINKRLGELGASMVGTYLGIDNREVSIGYIQDIFSQLNTNEEMGKFAEKVFETAKLLGVNVRFDKQLISKADSGGIVGGEAWGDMVQYNSQYFNDARQPDQVKAGVILHELIHTCTIYVMPKDSEAWHEYWKAHSTGYHRIAKAAEGLNLIYEEVKDDPDFKEQYGVRSPSEMVAELSNENFVKLLKKKSLWGQIVDWICQLFGFRRGDSAYDNARICVDFILDNPEVFVYKKYAIGIRDGYRQRGWPVFGSTTDTDGTVHYSDRDSEPSIEVTFEGKPFWAAMVNGKTGKIKKTWTYEEAKSEDFDLGRYADFADEDVFFTTELLQDNGRIEYDDFGERLPDDLIEKINRQIKVEHHSEELDASAVAERIRTLHDEIGTINRRLSNVTQWIDGAKDWLRQRADNQISFEEYEKRLRQDSYYRRLDDEKKALESEYNGLRKQLETLTGRPWKMLQSDVLYHRWEDIGAKYPKQDDTSYSDRDSDSISTRSLLANALEGAAQNDIERQKLAQYKQKISLIEAEQAKLSEIRRQIRELSFAKGPRDTERIKSLQFEERQAANRINTYDRQLLNLQATTALKNVLEREKKLAYDKAKKEGKEAMAAYREKVATTQRELITRWQDSRKKAVEGRNMTAMRHKIKDIAKELDTLLRKPTRDKHIKEELRKAVAEALLAINMDTIGADERVAKYDAMIAKAKDPDIIAELTASRDRIQLQGDNLKEKLDSLRMAYERIKDSEDIELSMAYQDVIRNSIEAVSKKVGDTSIRNMTLEQLEMVYELYSMIRKTIRDANKAFKAKKGETITQMAEAVNDQVRTVGGQPYKRNALLAAVQRVGWTFLKPFVAFRTIGSVTLTNLYKELRNGEDTFYGDVSEAQAFIEAQYEKHGYKSWAMKETKTFKAKSGKTFDLTLEQMMSLYAYSRRDQAHDHIIEGGIVFEDALVVEKKHGLPIKYEVTTKDAFNLSEETLSEIVASLTAEQKAFVEEMQAYLSDTMGAKGNDVSMELLGVKLFKEKFYLPIKSSQYYLNFSTEEAGEIKLKSPAFSKETVQHANNPIVLHSFTDLWAEHVNNMSMYHSFVLALEDFTRVYNYKTKTDAKVETMSTKKTIETAYPGATKYISNFLKSLNGGVRMDTVGFAEKLTSLAKKGSVLGSASVAIQQPSAVMRAMAVINPAYFITSAPKSINLLKHKQDWEELKKYAPIAGIKEMGRFDVGMGKDTADWIKANGNAMTKIEDNLSVAPAFMDEVTWVSIWNAVKRETIHNHKNLSPRSEEFLKIAGERFTEVISLTQVYDSVFSRSDIMRNKSWIAKALTAFMAEPTTTLNMLFDSFVQGKRTGSKKGFVKTTGTTTGAVIASLVLNAALKSIVMAMRDDDEDESYFESYMEHFIGDVKDSLNPLTMIPLAKDVVSIFKGYDVERMDMALFSDLKKAVDAFDSDTKTDYEKWSGLIGAISAFFGLPVKNVERDIRGLLTTIFGDSESTTAAGLLDSMKEGWTGEAKSNAQQLYEAMLKGDEAQVKRIEGRFKDQDAITSAIRKIIREKYEDGELSEKEAKSQLAEYAEMSEDEAASRVQYWDFKQEYPDYDDLSESAVAKYYSDVKPSGISIEVYYDYTKQRAKCQGTDTNGDGKADSGTKKREVMKLIHSLPITASQKDALYFAEGWAASTLYEAPWR